MNEKAGDGDVKRLVDEVLPIQQRHVAAVREGVLTLARDEDPAEDAS
jgi:hypothetical protein